MPEGPAGKALRGKTETRQFQKQVLREHPPKRRLSFLLQDWEDPYNVGGMFRVADAVGAEKIVLAGRTPAPPHPQISVTSLGAHRRVPYESVESWEEALNRLAEEGWHRVAVEIADNARLYTEYRYPEKVCLVMGNEEKGCYPATMRLVDGAVFIPMYGKGRSMNVHVSAAVVAYHAVMPG
jgi:tRNA (guanosine-2'-O-)-methyltransferase